MLILPCWAQQASFSQPPEKIIKAISVGDWKLVRTESIDWIDKDPRSSIAIFLLDTANSITHQFDGKFKTLLKYDYPYSDQGARGQIAVWVKSLLKKNEKNPNFLILNAAFQVKAFSNMNLATQFFEQAIEIKPNDEFISINLGNIYGLSNRSEKAEELFKNVLKHNHNSAGALNGLGMLAMSRKDMTEALIMFEKSVEAISAGPMEWFNLGSLYYYQKRLQKARPALEKAIALSPKMIEARFNLAGVYYALGRKADCIKQLRKIVDIDPTSDIGKRAQNNLRSLGY